jgi:hypothetical protein
MSLQVFIFQMVAEVFFFGIRQRGQVKKKGSACNDSTSEICTYGSPLLVAGEAPPQIPWGKRVSKISEFIIASTQTARRLWPLASSLLLSLRDYPDSPKLHDNHDRNTKQGDENPDAEISESFGDHSD